MPATFVHPFAVPFPIGEHPMSSTAFDFAPLLRPDLPPAAVKYTGFPPFNFVGGHNDAATCVMAQLLVGAHVPNDWAGTMGIGMLPAKVISMSHRFK
jgi:hypothetical protein